MFYQAYPMAHLYLVTFVISWWKSKKNYISQLQVNKKGVYGKKNTKLKENNLAFFHQLDSVKYQLVKLLFGYYPIIILFVIIRLVVSSCRARLIYHIGPIVTAGRKKGESFLKVCVKLL